MNKTTLSHTELLTIAFDKFNNDLNKLESQRNGNPELDKVINKMQEEPRAKLEIIKTLYQIETGKDLTV